MQYFITQRQKKETKPHQNFTSQKTNCRLYFRHFLIMMIIITLVYVCKYKIMIITQGMKIFAHTIEILLNT